MTNKEDRPVSAIGDAKAAKPAKKTQIKKTQAKPQDVSPQEGEDMPKRVERPELEELLRTYLESLRNILEAARIVVPHLATWLKDEIAKTEKKVDKYIGDEQQGKKELVFDRARDFVEFSGALRHWERLRSNKSLPLLVRSLYVQVFCEFDAFIGNLLKCIYLNKQDLLKGISREISLVDLLEYNDIESASRAMLDKEIDTFRRDSYIEQFAQLEKKFSLTLKKFPEWPQFVEATQRRNLLVHNDGIVNDQYLAVCRREGCVLGEDVALGAQLRVMPLDIAEALRLMSKVGYMLCHTLWSKIFPDEIDQVHQSLNSILFDCLADKRWKTAGDMGDFALTEPMKRNVSEVDFRIRLINTAIAKKFGGDEVATKALISSQDWSASYRDFRLAILVLEDKFEEAIDLMKEIGKSGELVHQEAYHSWPLFEKFREREDFYEVYEEIYGEPYVDESTELAAKTAAQAEKEKPTRRKRENKGAKALRKVD